jgi:hypothetical protein
MYTRLNPFAQQSRPQGTGLRFDRQVVNADYDNVYRMSTWHKHTTSERGVFFPQVTQDDTLSVSPGAIRKTDTLNRDASLL